MSANDSPLPQTPPVVNKERETAANTTTSSRFTKFLRNFRGPAGPVVKTNIVRVDIPLSSDVEGAEPEVGGTQEPVEHAESHDLEAALSSDSLSCLGGETDGEMVQQVTITRQEAIALTNVLEKIPRTAMRQDNQDLEDDITLTVVDKSERQLNQMDEMANKEVLLNFLLEIRGSTRALMIGRFYEARGEGPSIR